MYKLIISNARYDAIMHASHLLDNRSVVITISNGSEESNVYGLCKDALGRQRRFEVEKAYKTFGIRQLYCFNQDMSSLDYQFILLKLQLMLTVSTFTHLCYNDENPTLRDIYNGVTGVENRIIYLKEAENKSLTYELNDDEVGKKLKAIQKMPTIRTKLLYNNNYTKEYIKRTI